MMNTGQPASRHVLLCNNTVVAALHLSVRPLMPKHIHATAKNALPRLFISSASNQHRPAHSADADVPLSRLRRPSLLGGTAVFAERAVGRLPRLPTQMGSYTYVPHLTSPSCLVLFVIVFVSPVLSHQTNRTEPTRRPSYLVSHRQRYVYIYVQQSRRTIPRRYLTLISMGSKHLH
ncbi:hypothetical protein BKA81DRAFT_362699 [Phyllosticta paracitricarpa]